MGRNDNLESETVYLTPAQRHLIHILAAARDMTRSEYITQVLKEAAQRSGQSWPDEKKPRGRTPGVPQKRKSREIPPTNEG